MSKKRISISQIVERILRVGDISTGGSITETFFARAQQDLQTHREDHVKYNVKFSHIYSYNNFSVELHDTIHVLDEKHDPPIIEMIEIADNRENLFDPELELIPWAKAQIIAYLYVLKHNHEKVIINISWYPRSGLLTPKEKSMELSLKEGEKYFNDIFNKYIEWAGVFDAWPLLRDPSISDTEFPFNPYRPGQRAMMSSVFKAIKTKEHSLIQAPTGIGKTLASIFPAIKAQGVGLTDKIFYLTARTTGQAVAQEALRVLRKNGLKYKSVTITSKEKVCLRKKALKECDDCKYAKGYYARINDVLHVAFKIDEINQNDVERLGSEFLVCPFELSLDIALFADMIICDYNYAFDPNVYLKRFFGEAADEEISFLVDETHNLVDRSRSMYSAIISRSIIESLRRRMHNDAPDITEQMENLLDALSPLEDELVTVTTKVSHTPPLSLSKPARSLVRMIESWMGQKPRPSYYMDLIDLYLDIRHFLKISEKYDDCYATVHEKQNNDFSVKLFCLNPAPQLTKYLKKIKGAAFFSATVSPMKYFQQILGLGEKCNLINLPSPFPPENLCLFMADQVSTRFNKREFTVKDVVEAIGSLIWHRPGNYMVFFPAYHYMNQVAQVFYNRYPDIETLIQVPQMTESERQEYISSFSSDRSNTLLGFAVMGGIFGEGIDLTGDRLNGAIIVGVGLPGLSAERDLIRNYFDNYNQGFEFAYLYPGMNKVLQAAGRVIRTEKDRGVILLIDDRFATSRYRQLFPKQWTPISVRNSEDIRVAVKKFDKAE